MNLSTRALAGLTTVAFLLASCGGSGGGDSSDPANPPAPPVPTSVYATPAQEALTSADVEKILAQAIEEASSRNKPAAIAVVDRVGNALAIFQMNGTPTTLRLETVHRRVIPTDAEGLVVAGSPAANPLAAAALTKAITGAYLSSSGNAFSTRTASFIVQEHYPAGANQLPGGPLFGVQFSQLPCSDLNQRYIPAGGSAAFVGPKRSPLGLAADPGGFPLYKNGVVVGGIGVMSDGLYGYDPVIADFDRDDDEIIALAGTVGYEAPEAIRANNIQVMIQLRYSDATLTDLRTAPTGTRPFSALNGSVGSLITLPGYYGQAGAPAVLGGNAYGSEASGYRAATVSERSAGNAIDNVDAFILTDGSGQNRYPLRAGTDGARVPNPLTRTEVKTVLEEAFRVMSRTRAQIRKPLDSPAQVTLSIVDTDGSVLGLARSPDAPVFGTDVSLQKARTAAFFSGPLAADDLLANPSVDVQTFVERTRSFFGDPTALTGRFAFAARSIGNIARPFYPDGEDGRGPGPLSRPFDQWSPFSTGLQTALILDNIAEHLGFVLGASPSDTRQRCTSLPDIPGKPQNRLQNGIQIFSGAVPIYRGNVLVGALGISGDGIEQDDMIAFLGLHNGAQRAGGIAHAPPAIRADQIVVPVGAGVRPRYVNCPFAPFLDTSEQSVCDGK